MNRFYYFNSINSFKQQNDIHIFGEITKADQFGADDLQKNSWQVEIEILKSQFKTLNNGHIIFEYTIPRIGSRIDNIFIYKNIIFLLEFKVGEKKYTSSAKEQVLDYALDLSNFHKESHDKMLVPILVCTEAEEIQNNIYFEKNNILNVICCNKENLYENIEKIVQNKEVLNKIKYNLDEIRWINSIYTPTPTIVEAAQALFKGHKVEEISRNDATATNLTETTDAINKIIDYSKKNNKKSICFVTGVPGAGKTLAGLNIAIERQNKDKNEHAVFLSGNGPLVDVLQEALARDDNKRNNVTKKEALSKAKEFIQILHHFRDDAIATDKEPVEKVTVFDEAQRVWNKEMLSDFMQKKKGVQNFNMSEAEFLIDIMDRHKDYCVIICLVGGGQEINRGEAGILEWFNILKEKYRNWDIYVSNNINDFEYTRGADLQSELKQLNCNFVDKLHLSVSLRSFRSEKLAQFVKNLLDDEKNQATKIYNELIKKYPLYITRDLEKAKRWVKDISKGSERYGLIASSGARRLRKYGIWVQNKIDAPVWFLNDKEDIRSSYFLEETATEFDIQGLELDYTILCWDINLRYDKGFSYYNFKGSKWQNINKEESKLYLKNAYRVLLTRARQGMTIFVPEGDNNDITRNCKDYDNIYRYFLDIGIKEL